MRKKNILVRILAVFTLLSTVSCSDNPPYPNGAPAAPPYPQSGVNRGIGIIPGTTPGTTPGTIPGTTPGTIPGTTPGTTPGTIPGTIPLPVTFTAPGIDGLGVATNSKLSVTFSRAMNPATINTTTFTLMQGTTPVSGTVSYVGTTATFTPSSNLAANSTFTATITTGARDLAGNALATNFAWNFTTGGAPDTTPPAAGFVVPANSAPSVATNSKLSVTFGEAMDPATLNTTTFTLNQGATPVSGTVTYAGLTATFTPASNLAANSTFTGTVTTGAKDLAGNALANNFTWTFTTGAAPDTTAPTVSFKTPANGATGVPVNQKVAATFSEAMDPATITTTTFTVTQGNATVLGTVTYTGFTATFTPLTNLAANSTFTATITTGAKDLAGNALTGNTVWTFTTAAVPDTTRPTVTGNFPANNATRVPVIKKMTATFSEAMDPLTLTNTTFTLEENLNSVVGTVSYDTLSRTATFAPSSNLLSNTIYTAKVTIGVKDLAGNALGSQFSWTFTTGQAPVSLGSTASTFAVLAGSTVTNANATTVNGDLGVSPGTAVTGFQAQGGPGILNGALHAGDPTAATAKSELSTSFNDAAGRAGAPVTVAGNLGGQTLNAGLYKSTSSLEISSGDLTLDALGDPDAVFIFQMASTFTMTVSRQIILAGNAQTKNIFWQVGSSATIGTSAAFKGNILAAISITVVSGAVVDGRVLTQSGAVTLDANTINRPAL